MSLSSINLVFLDVDGVLLDFDGLYHKELFSSGIIPAEMIGAVEGWRNRPKLYSSEMFPGLISKNEARALLMNIFERGDLRTQSILPGVNKEAATKLLSDERVILLTKIPEAYAEDRLLCLERHFGVDLESRFLTSWTEEKSEIMRRVASRLSLPLEGTLLADDCPANLEGALKLGSKGFLVEHPYNNWAKEILLSYGEGLFDRAAVSQAHLKILSLLGDGE